MAVPNVLVCPPWLRNTLFVLVDCKLYVQLGQILQTLQM